MFVSGDGDFSLASDTKRKDTMEMMVMRKLAEYLVMNGYGLNSSGLYKGRAGISLALFETARLLQSEELEDAAYMLLEQALLTKTKDISFGNGLSGIAYALHFLIRHKFVEADFDDVFGEQMADIVEGLVAICDDCKSVYSHIGWVKFCHLFQHYKNQDAELALSNICNMFLSLYADKWTHIEDKPLGRHSVEKVMQEWKYILSAVCGSSFYHPELSFFEPFIRLYGKGIVKYDDVLFGYLHQIAVREEFAALRDFVAVHIRSVVGSRSIFFPADRRELSDVMSGGREDLLTAGQFFGRKALAQDWDEMEDAINRFVANGSTRLGLQGGIAWLLLLMVYFHFHVEGYAAGHNEH